MRNLAGRDRSRTTQLVLEAFERRDVLSGIHALLHGLTAIPLSSALLTVQTSDSTHVALTTADQNAVSSSTSSSDQGNAGALDDNAGGAESTVSSDTLLTDTVSATTLSTVSATEESTENTLASTGDTVASSDADSTTSVTTDAGTTSTGTEVIGEDTSSSQDTTATSTANTSDTSLDTSAQTTVDASASTAVSTLMDANALVKSTDVAYPTAVITEGQPSGSHSPSSTDSTAGPELPAVAVDAGKNLTSTASGQVSVLLSSATSTSDYVSRDHADGTTNPNRSSANGAPFFIGKVLSSESSIIPDHLSSLSERQERPLERSSLLADAKLATTGAVRLPSAQELLFIAQPLGARERLEAENPVCVLDTAGEMDDSAVAASARGAGLVSNPVLFDLDSLVREAQQFFEQIDQLSQDLGSVLARVSLLSGAVAVGVAATAAAVVSRRSQQAQCGLVLNSSAR